MSSLETHITAIEHYVFGKRLNDLVENVNELVGQYERYATKLAPGHISTARDATAHAPYHNFSKDLAARIESSLVYSSIRSMHFMWPSFAAGRHILRLFVAPADIEIDEAGMFKARCPGSEGLIEGSTLEVARPISKERIAGVGSIEALLLPQTSRVVICVFLGHELIATIDALTGSINDPEAATACDRLSSYLALEAASAQIADEVYFRSGRLADQVHFKLRARAKAKAYEFFSNLALGRDSGIPQDENILREMDEGGVVQLLARHPGQAEWLARLSLSVGGRTATFAEAASHWGVTADDVKKWLVAINETISMRCGKGAFAIGDK